MWRALSLVLWLSACNSGGKDPADDTDPADTDPADTDPADTDPADTDRSDDTDPADDTDPPDDADNDGFSPPADCDDNAAGVNPAAADPSLDGTDQNCDGVDGTDADGDGAASTATGGGDCDDNNDQVRPGAVELCDGFDNDCAGGEPRDQVSIDGGATFTELQDALDASAPGDVLRLCPGTWSGAWVIPHHLSLLGSGAEQTTLVGLDEQPVLSAEGVDLTLAGLTLTHNERRAPDAPPTLPECGGGLRAEGGGTVVLRGVVARDNLAGDGAGLCLRELDAVELQGVEVSGNYAAEAGGIASDDVLASTWSDVRLEDNLGRTGGARHRRGPLTAAEVVVDRNGALLDDTLPADIGGLEIDAGGELIHLTNLTLTRNEGETVGGAQLWGEVTLEGVTSEDNHGRDVGGLVMFDRQEDGLPASLSITSLRTARGEGAFASELYVDSAELDLSDAELVDACTTMANPEETTALLVFGGDQRDLTADALTIEGSRCVIALTLLDLDELTLTNFTLRDSIGSPVAYLEAARTLATGVTVHNNASLPGGVGDDILTATGEATFTDVTLTDNDGDPLVHAEGTLTLSRCTVERNAGDVAAIDEGDISDCTFRDNINGALYATDAVIERSTFERNGNPAANGGAILGGRLTLVDCQLTDNEALDGGAILAEDVELQDCTLERNTAADDGGAVTVRAVLTADAALSLEVRGGALRDNAALDNGGGLYSLGGRITLSDVDLERNRAEGGAALYAQVVDVTVDGCRVQANEAEAGGLMFAAADATILRTTFSDNSADAGAAIYAFGTDTDPGDLLVQDSTFTGNATNAEGGAISASAQDLVLLHSTFVNNTSTFGGAVMANQLTTPATFCDNTSFVSNSATQSGGAIYVVGQASGAELLDCTFDDNLAPYGAALLLDAALAAPSGPFEVQGGHFARNVATDEGGAIFLINIGVPWALTLNLVDLSSGPNDNLPDDLYLEDQRAYVLDGTTSWACASTDPSCP
jgi:predicted outer membrane repeat protein